MSLQLRKQKWKILEPLIPKEYRDLAEVFSKRESNVLLPHCPMFCTIEIVPGAKLPKLKLYSMMPREMEELQAFVNKNLTRGFIQLAKS